MKLPHNAKQQLLKLMDYFLVLNESNNDNLHFNYFLYKDVLYLYIQHKNDSSLTSSSLYHRIINFYSTHFEINETKIEFDDLYSYIRQDMFDSLPTYTPEPLVYAEL